MKYLHLNVGHVVVLAPVHRCLPRIYGEMRLSRVKWEKEGWSLGLNL